MRASAAPAALLAALALAAGCGGGGDALAPGAGDYVVMGVDTRDPVAVAEAYLVARALCDEGLAWAIAVPEIRLTPEPPSKAEVDRAKVTCKRASGPTEYVGTVLVEGDGVVEVYGEETTGNGDDSIVTLRRTASGWRLVSTRGAG